MSALRCKNTPKTTPGRLPKTIGFTVGHDHLFQNGGSATTSASIKRVNVIPKATAGSVYIDNKDAPAKLAPDPNPAFDIPEKTIAAAAIIKKEKSYSIYKIAFFTLGIVS